MRHRVTLKEPTETRDAYGEPVKTWTTMTNGQIWAEKRDLSGNELVRAQQVNSEITTEFRIRYRADLNGTIAVVLGDVYYHVHAVTDPEGRKRDMVLLSSRSMN